jgi:hypothetical protein
MMLAGRVNPKANKNILERGMKTGIVNKNVYFAAGCVVQSFK